MAINISDVEPRVQYTATSGQTSFTVPFEFFVNADLKVYNGSTLLSFAASPADATEYSVTGAGVTGGGSITLGSPGATVNDIITISRDIAIARTTDFPTSGAFQIASLNEELDKIVAMCGQLERDLKFSPRASATTSNTFDITFPNLVAGKLLGVNSSGNGLEFSVDASALLSAETNAANSAAAAATSATASANSATASQTAQAAAEAALDTFDDDFLGSKSSDPSVDNDGNALADGALYFNTTDNVMKVYDLGNTQWKQLTPTNSQQTNIDAAVANATNINNVAGQISPTNNVGTVAGISSDITTLAGISGLSTLAGSASSVIAAGNNLADINAFANIYLGPSSSAPTQDPDGSALDSGDLYFDTATNQLKVYGSSGWQSAGSTVNGTSARFIYNITGTPTTLSGSSGTGYAEANGNVLAYDSGFLDIFVNGVKQVLGTDVTATSGNSVVFASALANGDVVDIVAYGTFQLANISIKDLTDTPAGFGTAGQALVMNSSANALEFANASSAEVYGFKTSFTASTLNRTVTVVSVGGSNKYFIDGVQQDTLELLEGNTYIFTHPSGHPFRFSTNANNSPSAPYTTGVTVDSSTQVTLVVAADAPTLYYYCSSHSNMGGTAYTNAPADNTLQVVTTNGGADNITQSEYEGFIDVQYAATGFTWSISNGKLIATV
jgi:hypothetical protein